jgi:molybdopterin molybdotransferase
LHLENSLTPIVETEVLPIDLAVGRILATDLQAASDSPPFSNSAVDGYAFRFADVCEKYLELKKVGQLRVIHFLML